jgi:uncharacterized lipoprotein YbaY
MATEIAFELEFDPALVDETATYTLAAAVVDEEGNLLFVNDTTIPVITGGAPTEDVDVPVVLVAAFSPMVEPSASPSA